jgi:HemY protein
MKRLLIYFLILLAAVWLGLKIQADAGYILIYYRNWTIETTLWMAALVILLGFLLFYIILRFFYNSKILPQRLRLWWHNFRECRAIKLTDTGLLRFAEEAWASAEKCFVKAARYHPNPFLNYLKAAKAAQKQNAFSRRDNYLAKAHQLVKKSDIAFGIIQAKMQISSKQWEQAIAILKHLQTKRPRDKVILRMLQRVHRELNDWQDLQNLLPLLRKREVLSPSELLLLEQQVYMEFWLARCKSFHPNDIKKLWLEIPRHMRNNVELVSHYAHYLLKNNLNEVAEELLRDVINKSWQPKLLELYAAITSAKPVKQLAHAEKWLKLHPTDPDLLICLGKICKKQALWGKARHYFEKSIKLMPTPIAYLELGQVVEIQGEKEMSLDYYRKGLQFCSKN